MNQVPPSKELDIAEVGAVEVDDVLVVAFMYPESGSTIEFQRSLGEPDPQVVELGQDTYCLCVDAGAVNYGGVEGWVVEGDTFAFALSKAAAATLGMEREHAVVFDPAALEEPLSVLLTRVIGPSEATVRPHCMSPTRVARVRFLTEEEGGRTTDPMSGVRPALSLGRDSISCLVTTGDHGLIPRGKWNEVLLQPVVPGRARAFTRLKDVRLYDGSRLVAVGEFTSG